MSKLDELQIFQAEIPRQLLDAVPETHRSAYLVMGHIANEIAILQTLTIQAINGATGGEAKNAAAIGMALLLTRVICGRLYEVSALIRGRQGKCFDDMTKDFEFDADDKIKISIAREARSRLNKYFSESDTLLAKVRNKTAFHTDMETVRQSYSLLPADLALKDFHTSRRGSTFYGGCDTVAAYSVAHLLEKTSISEALEVLMEESRLVASYVADFVDGFMLVFALRYMIPHYKLDENTEILHVQPLDQATLNFFTLPPSQ